jgi:hypothetical protein
MFLFQTSCVDRRRLWCRNSGVEKQSKEQIIDSDCTYVRPNASAEREVSENIDTVVRKPPGSWLWHLTFECGMKDDEGTLPYTPSERVMQQGCCGNIRESLNVLRREVLVEDRYDSSRSTDACQAPIEAD